MIGINLKRAFHSHAQSYLESKTEDISSCNYEDF